MSGRHGTGRVGLSEAQRALVTAHLWLAEAIAREFAWLRPKTVDGDVSQPAYEGLVKAAQGYDAATGLFVPYARKWVIGEVLRAADARSPGFSRRYAPALEIFGELSDDGTADVAYEMLDHAAAVMCIAGESLRLAQSEPSGLSSWVGHELDCLPEEKRAMFIGWAVDGRTWEDLAQSAGVSVSTAKRWVEQIRADLVLRLRQRRTAKTKVPASNGP